MTNSSEPVADGRSAPAAPTQDAACPPTRFCCGPVLGCCVALVGGLLTWGTLQWLFPVFEIPKELQDLPTPQPSDLAAKADQAMVVAARWNATLTLAILGLLMGAFLAAAESVSRGVARAAWWRGLVSATIAGLFGAAGGLVASLLMESPQMTADMSPLARTICGQCLGLGLLGLGVGLGVGLTAGGLRLIASSAVGGILGGLITGFLYPAGVGYLLPSTQTESVVPIEMTSRGVWLAAITLLIAFVLTGLGRKGKRGPRA